MYIMGDTMRIRISRSGKILKYNKYDELHSFNGKPAVIHSNGRVVWYENGILVKAISSGGKAIFYKPYDTILPPD